MKYVFLAGFVLLLMASLLTAWMMPDARSEVPVIYWVTDSNPARKEQVRLFHEWLVKNGHCTEVTIANEDDAEAFRKRLFSPAVWDTMYAMDPKSKALREGTLQPTDYPFTIRIPKTELKLDMANADRTKKIIQGVSGVAGDVMDQGSGGDLRYFRAMGLNTDVTEAAKELGFDPSKTYPELIGEITLENEQGERRQFQFPCNVSVSLYYVNRETFRQHGRPIPPRRWTMEEFEEHGRAFVAAANKGRSRQTVFFADAVPWQELRNSMGGSRFNETGTAPTLSAYPNIESWRKGYQWIEIDRLIPNASDRQSFATESGYGGPSAQLFCSQNPDTGQYAMMWTGRYLLIEYRKFDVRRKAAGQPLLDLGTSEAPNGGFPNSVIVTRAAMVYAGGKNKHPASLFLAFLASEDYNMQIVRDADSLPPNPEYTKLEEYLRPKDHPNEWDLHGAFADAAIDLAVGNAYSQFIIPATADRIENGARDKYLNRLLSVEEAAALADRQIREEMELNMQENPQLVPVYERLVARQKEIDQKKLVLAELEKAGKPIPAEAKIPLDWIENDFYKKYYTFKGWAE